MTTSTSQNTAAVVGRPRTVYRVVQKQQQQEA